MSSSLQLLLIEDDAQDAALLERLLTEARSPSRFHVHHCASLESGLEHLKSESVDALLLDLYLPDSSGSQTVVEVRKRDPNIPIVVFTGRGDDGIALHALQAGAQDYLVKDELTFTLLQRAIRYAIERQRMRQENERLHERVAQLSKHESLGLLAGGIAHDFNNLLTVVLANAKMIHDRLPAGGELRPAVDAISVSANVAAQLTEQLLTYSGQARPETAALDVSAQIEALEPLLKSVASDDVELRLSLAPNLLAVEGDAAQITQLVMNLVLNAAEASRGGSSVVEVVTRAVTLTESTLPDLTAGSPLEPGPHIVVEVRDFGCGMDDTTLKSIFDPFFTTKFTGRGLGLASVLGVVQNHAGGVTVESYAGRGSVFSIYLPSTARPIPAMEVAPAELDGHGQILDVDDDESVAEVVQWSLRSYGYTVRSAHDGWSAIEEVERRGSEIDLVLMDLTMPGIDGRETLRRLRQLRPGIRVILSTGYDAAIATEGVPEDQFDGFLQKPFEPSELAAVVKRCLSENDPQREVAFSRRAASESRLSLRRARR